MSYNDDPDVTLEEIRPTDEVECDHRWKFLNSRNAFVCRVCYVIDYES